MLWKKQKYSLTKIFDKTHVVFFGIIFGVVRIAEGGHFFSDVLFSGVIVFVFSFLIKNIFKKYYGH